MLTTSRASRRRLAAGSAAVTLLVAGGLGLTASGSQAAERIGASVDAALQAAPVAPPAPPAAVAPPVTPDAPPPREAQKKRVVIVRDGKTETYEGADADQYIAEHDLPVPPTPPAVAGAPDAPRVVMRRFRAEKDKDGKLRTWRIDVPEVSNATCPGDNARPVVENSVKDGRHRIIVCTNRVEAMSREAERIALNSAEIERHAMISARSSLAMARAAIERERNLSEDQRREALAGIAQAEAELDSDAKD